MASILLFCVNKDAKPLVRAALERPLVEGSTNTQFYLVEKRTCPDSANGFRKTLEGDEDFQTEWEGASPAECKAFTLAQRGKNFITTSFLAIADERTASDDTLSMHYFSGPPHSPLPPEEEACLYGGHGKLPKEANTWYDFRIACEDAVTFEIHLTSGLTPTTFVWYFAMTEQFTNDDGVFDVKRAERIIFGKEKDPNDA